MPDRSKRAYQILYSKTLHVTLNILITLLSKSIDFACLHQGYTIEQTTVSRHAGMSQRHTTGSYFETCQLNELSPKLGTVRSLLNGIHTEPLQL